ncbi:hypothetical protein HZY97_00140 [Sphingomonas sp. R-74633]|uniref:hypothetical protein n=1 Tax=Sphingomonas sp. R-74633 TaxID=2751188 RepID=UPI0015D41784|nr:hypothetical protein [Sphingomonas sp. R-74633]NYT39151.1 hypothetical protein [Sphingomonas sp. R-74633]
MKTTFRTALAWLLVNLAGIGAFLALASQYWAEPQITDPSDPIIGEAIGWFLATAPILLLFGLANMIWLIISLRGEPLHRWWRPILLLALVYGCWQAGWLFDNAHHGV